MGRHLGAEGLDTFRRIKSRSWVRPQSPRLVVSCSQTKTPSA